MDQRTRIRLQMEDQSQQQQTEAEKPTAEHDTRSPSAEASPAQSLLQMQRTQGNQAVQRLVGHVQRVPYENGGELDEDLSQQINSKRGSGQSLDNQVADSMSQQMGFDFSGVNVHTDTTADRLSRSIGARAFTTGSDIFFKSGEYNPGSSDGQGLLAHELTHVVQQGGQPPSGGNLTVGPASDSYESEADQLASSLTSGDGLQRQPVDEEEGEEIVAMKRDDIQREALEEEEMLQMKRDDLQRESLPEEEELQA